MKKIFILLLLFTFTGCKSKQFEFNNILSINYQNNSILKEDYQEITQILSQTNFYCGKQKNYKGNSFTITTNNHLYKFNISNNYYMEFVNSNDYCHTKDTEKVEKIINKLNNIITNYTDISFFTIRNEYNYIKQDKDTYIKLDNNNDYIIINSKKPLYEFKINQIEYTNNNSFKEIGLLYSVDEIYDKDNLVIRKEILTIPDIKISFKNEYGYFINILPIMNKNNEINFITEIKK